MLINSWNYYLNYEKKKGSAIRIDLGRLSETSCFPSPMLLLLWYWRVSFVSPFAILEIGMIKFYFSMMALRENNCKDWIFTCCKEHSYWYPGLSCLTTAQSHLQSKLLSPFQASAWSNGITNKLVLHDNTYL